MPLDRHDLLRLYRYMRLTRSVEDRVRALYYAGKIVGGVYTGTGMEATSVGAAYALEPGDVVAPLRRDLGAHLVRGTTPREVFLHYLARADGPSGGRDGGLHFGDMRGRMIVPATGVVGASLPVAVGTALAARIRGERRVALAFIGEGGTSTGDFHEAMNLSASLQLPFVCVVEHNGYAYTTPAAVQARIDSFAQRAAAYGIPSGSVDGNDVLAVYHIVREAVEQARSGADPALIEARTFRMRGHSEADPAAYVPPALLEEWAARDPLAGFEAYLAEAELFSGAEKAEIEAQVQAEIDDAAAFAEAAPPADPDSLTKYVYAGEGNTSIPAHRSSRAPTADLARGARDASPNGASTKTLLAHVDGVGGG